VWERVRERALLAARAPSPAPAGLNKRREKMGVNKAVQWCRCWGVGAVVGIAAAAALSLPQLVQAQADSVSAGKFRGGWKDLAIDSKKQVAPQAVYLLKDAQLGRTYRDIGLHKFGLFTNNSDYALSLVLNHDGGQSNRRHYIWVDGYMVGRAYSIDATAPVIIQPHSTYEWEVVDSYRITAWVLTDEVINKRLVSEAAGLPSEAAFQNPQPLYGAYLGCVTVYEDRYLDFKFEGTVLQATYWLYKYLRMNDGGAPGGSVVFVPEFKQDAFLGGAPTMPGVCLNRREAVYNIAPQKDEDKR
jgi:hypothetical protein